MRRFIKFGIGFGAGFYGPDISDTFIFGVLACFVVLLLCAIIDATDETEKVSGDRSQADAREVVR